MQHPKQNIGKFNSVIPKKVKCCEQVGFIIGERELAKH